MGVSKANKYKRIMNFLCMKFFGILSIIYAVTATPESETRVKRQSLTVVVTEYTCVYTCVTISIYSSRRAMATNCFDKCCGENLCGRKCLLNCIGGLRRLLNENFTDMDNNNNNNTITTTI